MGERTIGILPALATLATLQIVLALIVAVILGAFHRFYRQAYVRHWSLGWLALAVYVGATLAGGALGGQRLRLLAVTVALVAGYLQVAWLLLGVRELATGADVPSPWVRRVVAAAITLGVASVGLVLARSPAPGAVGLRCLVAGVAYVSVPASILARRRPPTRLGAAFAGAALLLYGADQLAYFGLTFLPPGSQLGRLPLLMSFDILATAVMGLALVTWLLEVEREKQVHAAELARRRERAQACVYRISEAARTVWDLPELFRSIHESLGDVIPARNFYIALRDPGSGLLSFPYFADERDQTPAPKPLGRGLTEYVLRKRRPLLATPEVFRDLVAHREVELVASDSVDWLGAPLLARGEAIGVAAVQTYDPAVRLGLEERDLFVFVCGQIAAAIEAKRAGDALRESEARLRVAIQQVPAVLWTTDEELHFTSSLGAGLTALGLAPNQVVGLSLEQYLGPRSAGLARHRLALQGESVGYEYEQDGRWFTTHVEPLRDTAGAIRGTVGIAVDITDRKATEEALRRAAKEESLTVLAGGVAHDFNNLLAAILGHAALALKLLPEGSLARRHVEKAASAVERAADLTRQMLAYSGRGHFVVRPTDVNALVRENLPLFQVAVPKGVRLEARLDSEPPLVDADAGQIQQVLMNLVINAAEAIGEPGGTVTVSTGVRDVAATDEALWRASGQPLAPGRYVSLEVRDDGPGMDADTVDRIFEPFFSTKFTGRGLGLAAVLGVVRGHRGALSVASAPGRGTVFRILFAPSALPASAAAPAAPSPARTATVLLIDDEAVVRDVIGEVLESEGFEVLRAEDGARGVALLRDKRGRVDVVLLDLSMPGLSGEETFRRLREIDPGVRVILSSGYDNDEASGRFGAARPAGFIQKPYRPEQLVAEISRCIGPQPA